MAQDVADNGMVPSGDAVLLAFTPEQLIKSFQTGKLYTLGPLNTSMRSELMENRATLDSH